MKSMGLKRQLDKNRRIHLEVVILRGKYHLCVTDVRSSGGGSGRIGNVEKFKTRVDAVSRRRWAGGPAHDAALRAPAGEF
jgi:hypothetical protein